MAKLKIRPLQDRLVVRRLTEEEKTAGGIIIPDTAKEKPQEAEVVAVGDGKVLESGQVRKLTLKAGDRILFSKYSGNEIELQGIEHLILKEEDGQTFEPFEELIIDAPEYLSGVIIEKVAKRKGTMTGMKTHHDNTRLVFEIPTRGLLGLRSEFIIDTRGEGIMSSRVIGFRPHAGDIKRREVGSMISMVTGKTLGYALYNLQDRGTLYIGPNIKVYEGMVIGNVTKGTDMAVNPTKGKNLTNVRASGSDEALNLTPPMELTLERGLEIMADDELLEITPRSVRLRKKVLNKRRGRLLM